LDFVDKAAPRVWGFVILVDLLALATLWFMPVEHLTKSPWMVVLLMALTALVGTRPVHLRWLGVKIAATHPFIFCALAVLGGWPAVLVGVCGIVGAQIGSPKALVPVHFTFNMGASALSTGVAWMVFTALGGEVGQQVLAVIPPLTAATAAFFVANSCLVTGVIVLDKGQRFSETWIKTFRWTAVTYLAGMPLAVLMIFMLDSIGPWGLAIGIPPTWMILGYYKANKEKTEEQQRRIKEVETLNAHLEERVEERTHELAGALDQIKELQSLKATLTQTLVHDLKNPLAAVAGNLDLLEMQNDNERVLRLVRRSRTGADRLHRMIMDLMDIARMEEGRFQLSEERLDPCNLAKRALDNAEASFEQQGVQLVLRRPEEPCSFRADPAVMHRVLDNLLANALRYSPKDGAVTIGFVPGAETFEITVSDQGKGIPEQYREKVFEKYAQVELREAGVSINRGLGLTFCQLAIEAHGGKIVADEAPGGGAMFRVMVPVRTEDDTGPAVPQVPREHRDAPAQTALPVKVTRVGQD
jgi:signal transduction histidine kinase